MSAKSGTSGPAPSLAATEDEDPRAVADALRPAAVAAWVEEMSRRGVREQGHVLRPSTEAATARVRLGVVLVKDGPVADGPLQISGFKILECADMEEALDVAAKHPVARFGILELRPFAD